jgi:hypothetical protein
MLQLGFFLILALVLAGAAVGSGALETLFAALSAGGGGGGGAPSPAPAPLIGMGLPIVGGVFAAVLLVLWRLRSQSSDWKKG